MPLDKEQKITDDTRIRAAVPTLKYLLDKGAKVLLTSHLVRSIGAINSEVYQPAVAAELRAAENIAVIADLAG